MTFPSQCPGRDTARSFSVGVLLLLLVGCHGVRRGASAITGEKTYTEVSGRSHTGREETERGDGFGLRVEFFRDVRGRELGVYYGMGDPGYGRFQDLGLSYRALGGYLYGEARLGGRQISSNGGPVGTDSGTDLGWVYGVGVGVQVRDWFLQLDVDRTDAGKTVAKEWSVLLGHVTRF